jgi:hypothetical protein
VTWNYQGLTAAAILRATLLKNYRHAVMHKHCAPHKF